MAPTTTCTLREHPWWGPGSYAALRVAQTTAYYVSVVPVNIIAQVGAEVAAAAELVNEAVTVK